MDIERIHREIEQLRLLIEGWRESGEIKEIEREIALDKLSRVYEQIRFEAKAPIELEPIAVVAEVAIEPLEETEEEPQEESVVDESIFEINIDSVSLEESVEPEEETEVEIEITPKLVIEPEPTPEPEPEPEPVIEEPTEEPKSSSSDNMLFDIDIIPKQSRRRRNTLMSLYQSDDQPTKVEPTKEVTPEPEPPIEQTPEHEEPVTLTIDESIEIAKTPELEPSARQTIAEAMTTNVKSVAEKLAEKQNSNIFNERVRYCSFNDLGINERYLLSRELFGDDPQHCRQALDNLEACTNYDDAMIYIAENFDWREDSTGANVILTILENKFNI